MTLEVTPEQAEKINVATELGKLSLTLRSVSGTDGVARHRRQGLAQNRRYQADLGGRRLAGAGRRHAAEEGDRCRAAAVEVIHGSKTVAVKPQ